MDYYYFNNDNVLINSDKIHYYYHENNFPFKTLHGHYDYWEFTIVTRGKLKHVCNGKEEIISSGHLFFQTTKDTHYITEINENNKEMVYFNLIVRESTLIKLCEGISNDFFSNLINGKRVYRISESLIYNIQKIIHKTNLLTKNEYDKYDKFLCSAILLILQHIFISQLSGDDTDENFVRKINDIMNDIGFLKLSVDELASKTGYSRMHLDRLIKKHFNQTPHEFLTTYRIRYAENLLLSTEMSVQDICKIVGYNGFPIFCSNFKKEFGVTPLQYRLKNR